MKTLPMTRANIVEAVVDVLVMSAFTPQLCEGEGRWETRFRKSAESTIRVANDFLKAAFSADHMREQDAARLWHEFAQEQIHMHDTYAKYMDEIGRLG